MHEIFYNSQFKKYNCNSTHSYNRKIWVDIPSCIIFPCSQLETVTCKITKNRTRHSNFSKNFTISAEQRYWKMHPGGCFWQQLYFGNFPEWLLLKDSCKDIFILEILSYTTVTRNNTVAHILHFLLWRHVKEEQIFMDFGW